MKKFIIPCIIIMTSCQQPTVPAVQESIPAPQIITEEVMERTITMKPIPDMLGYLFKNGFLRGITSETGRADFTPIRVEAIINEKLAFIILDDFFTENGKKYFSFTDRYIDDETETEKGMYYEQTSSKVKEIEIMPDKPVAGKIEGTYGDFVFSLYDWEGVEYNKLMRGNTIVSTAKGFDSAVLVSTGIIFSQPETLSRISGLWYMGNTQKGGPTRIGDYQFIY